MNGAATPRFRKMNGLGNDFVVLDARAQPIQISEDVAQAPLFLPVKIAGVHRSVDTDVLCDGTPVAARYDDIDVVVVRWCGQLTVKDTYNIVHREAIDTASAANSDSQNGHGCAWWLATPKKKHRRFLFFFLSGGL